MTAETVGDEVEKLREEILRIWGSLLQTSDLSIDDDFFDKGGDSLLATELMLELRRLTGKALPDSVLFESSTVKALAQRLSEIESVRPKVAVRVGEATEGAKPLIFFHGDWTRGGFYVEHLARKLGSQFSLIAVAPHGPGGERIPSSIEEMAADRLPAILEAQPTGPYRLAGHCVGGIVALETARLLMRQNQGVESLVMIDSPVMIGGEVARSRPGAPDGGDGSSVAESEGTPIRPQTPEIDWGIEPYSERLAIYSPAPLPLPLRLLVISAEYDGRGWVRLSDNAALQEIYGYHFDLVTRRIDDLARRMRSWLTSEAPPHSAERRTAAMSAGTNDKEIPHPPIDAAKHESLSRRLGRFFGYGRR